MATNSEKDKKHVTVTGSDADKKDAAVHAAPSSTSTISPKNQGCCYRFWNSIFKVFAKDAIYGSFVGPHPVNFIVLCCNCCCKKTCMRPFALASIATKLMWFIMLLIIMLLSCFFIVPYGSAQSSVDIANAFPCKRNGVFLKMNNNMTKTCNEHGGYFMVYRNFFAFELLLLMSCFIMINVKSTSKNKKRAKMMHGFWMYKYIILIFFLFIAFLAIPVAGGGIFEYIISWLGHLSVFVFSFAEVTFLLDVVELFSAKNRASTSDWADCVYWTMFGVIMALNFGIIMLVCIYYGNWQLKNNEGIDWEHVGIIIYAIILSGLLLAFSIFNCLKKKFKYDGLLQSSFVILYVLTVIWTALGSSDHISSRPILNLLGNKGRSNVRAGNQDTYFKFEPFVSGLVTFLSLMYYVFGHGPRSTAPLSLLFDTIFYKKAKKSEVPVVPELLQEPDPYDPDDFKKDSDTAAATETDTGKPAEEKIPEKETDTPKTSEKETQKHEDLALEFTRAIEERRVWDDEKKGVRYSWCLFYVFMMLGSFSIMMAMTNFFDPWAVNLEASSLPTLGVKLIIALYITIIYIAFTTLPCPKIYPVSGSPEEEEAKKDVDVEKGPSDEKTDVKSPNANNSESATTETT